MGSGYEGGYILQLQLPEVEYALLEMPVNAIVA